MAWSCSILGLKSKQENSKHSKVNELLKKCLQGYRGNVKNSNETLVISNVLFEVAEVGNICWALWNLVVFDPNDDQTRNNVAWFLMGDFLRLSPCA